MPAAPLTKTVRRIFLRDILRVARSVIWLTRASKLEPNCLHAIARSPSQSAPAAGAAASRSFSCCGAAAVIGMDSPSSGGSKQARLNARTSASWMAGAAALTTPSRSIATSSGVDSRAVCPRGGLGQDAAALQLGSAEGIRDLQVTLRAGSEQQYPQAAELARVLGCPEREDELLAGRAGRLDEPEQCWLSVSWREVMHGVIGEPAVFQAGRLTAHRGPKRGGRISLAAASVQAGGKQRSAAARRPTAASIEPRRDTGESSLRHHLRLWLAASATGPGGGERRHGQQPGGGE